MCTYVICMWTDAKKFGAGRPFGGDQGSCQLPVLPCASFNMVLCSNHRPLVYTAGHQDAPGRSSKQQSQQAPLPNCGNTRRSYWHPEAGNCSVSCNAALLLGATHRDAEASGKLTALRFLGFLGTRFGASSDLEAMPLVSRV